MAEYIAEEREKRERQKEKERERVWEGGVGVGARKIIREHRYRARVNRKLHRKWLAVYIQQSDAYFLSLINAHQLSSDIRRNQ